MLGKPAAKQDTRPSSETTKAPEWAPITPEIADATTATETVWPSGPPSQPLLTREESELLDICDRLEPLITEALEEASGDMMRVWAKSLGLNDEQAEILREHEKDCPNTRSELARASRAIESHVGYLLYANFSFRTRQEMVEDPSFQQIMYSLSLARVRKEDEERIRLTIMPAVEETVERIMLGWDSETNRISKLSLKYELDSIWAPGGWRKLLRLNRLWNT